jgi:ATP-dependent HslUV protease subunit HslV
MFHGTTIIAVRKDTKIAIAGDGQVTFGNSILKEKAKKVRKIFNDKIIVGFAGATADAFTLFDKFNEKLEKFNGNITRSSVELAKDWRTDRILRRLEALMIVADKDKIFTISGSGDVIEPDDNIAAIGSGGPYALAAARALIQSSNLTAPEIVREAMTIAAGICIYTNKEIEVVEL